jgi:hypothetical protein
MGVSTCWKFQGMFYPYETCHMTFAPTKQQQFLVRLVYYIFDIYGTVRRSAIAVAGNQKRM